VIEIVPWIKREFAFDLPVGVFPPLLERLRGTPARAKQLIVGISEEMLAARPNGKWSVKDHLGHLVDLRALDEQRLREFLGRAKVLSAADASNRATTAAANVPLSPGQTIVLLHQEFPSNVYAWRELAKKKGGRIVTVERSSGTSYTEALERAINKDTAIVALPQSHWTDGSKIDLERIGGLVRSVGASLVIDASQSLGACPLDLSRVQPDFLVAVGYKWLLGPYGLGYLYVAPKWRDSGTPLEQSWLTRAGSEDFARLVEYRDEYRQSARRFDAGEFPQFVLVPMAIAALQQILSWKVARIGQALSFLTERAAGLAVENGYSVLPRSERCGHMIGIRHSTGIPAKLAKSLKDANVFVSIRGDSIRVAPHLYNDLSDVERLFEVLRAARN